MIEWKDTSSWAKNAKDRSEPKEWTATISGIRLVVHHHIHHEPDVWLASAKPGVFDNEVLASPLASEAKCQAVAILQSLCEKVIREITA